VSERLEEQLRALGLELFPPEPDLRAAVLARLDTPPRRLPGSRGRPLLALVALLLALAAAALAIPQARSALERWLGLGAARIERVDTLPPLTRGTALTGAPTSRAAAAQRLGGRLYLPQRLGAPDELRATGLGIVAAWGDPVRIRLLEVPTGGPYFEKELHYDTSIRHVRVAGQPGIWIDAPHGVQFAFGQPELAGKVLLWERGGVTLRLDGRIGLPKALRIARSTETVKTP
jgi:hypothetical protein